MHNSQLIDGVTVNELINKFLQSQTIRKDWTENCGPYFVCKKVAELQYDIKDIKIMNKLITKALLAFALCFSASSFAGVITDTVVQNEFLTTWTSHTYSHDINDNGFTLGTALSGTLEISIGDDADSCGWTTLSGCEVILFTVEDFDFDTGSVTLSGLQTNLDVKALAELNADGLLDVTVTSILGDFYVGDSVLTVNTADVPEPSSMALFGLGLLGLGLTRRRIQQA